MTQRVLKIKDLCKSYYVRKKTFKHALVDVNVELNEGEIFALLGVNGAGKTTLSSIIATLTSPTKGDVLWQDKSVYDDLSKYRKILGFCPQYQNLDDQLTLEQNLIFQGKYYGLSKGHVVLKAAELLTKFELNEYAKSKVFVLSGGYKQRFLIARTLVHNPRLVILDEPTVGLDPQVRHQLWKHILDLKKEGITILLTTHYLDEAEKLSDRVCVIDQGKVLIIDSPNNLKNNLQKNSLEEVFLHLLKEENRLCHE